MFSSAHRDQLQRAIDAKPSIAISCRDTPPTLHQPLIEQPAGMGKLTAVGHDLVKLRKVEPLKGEALAAFQGHAAPLLTQLGRMESASLYASRD